MTDAANTTGNLAAVDWTAIPFPGDRLTTGRLRAMAGGDVGQMEVLLHNLAVTELALVDHTARAALAIDDTDRRLHGTMKDLRAGELAELYVEYGLAGGSHEAAELVRGLEACLLGEIRRRNPDRPR